MQDLSKIDFSECKLPELRGHQAFAYLEPTGVTVAWSLYLANQQHGVRYDLVTRGHGKPWKIITSSLTREESDLLWSMTDTVDAFIESELAKQSEPEWRPCSKEFALDHASDSQWQCEAAMEEWSPIDVYQDYCSQCEFRTKAPLQQQPDRLDTRSHWRTYSARGERKVTSKFGTSLGFAGGRENTPRAEIVRSNYHNANQNEANIKITGQCSVETLRAILAWAESQLELVPDEDRCYPAPGWWRAK